MSLLIDEKHFANFLDRAVEGIFQSAPSGAVLRANPALARILGFRNPQELITHYTDMKSQFYVDPRRRETFLRLMREFGEVTAFESEVRRLDGSTIWVSENAWAVYDDHGELLCYEGTMVDVTRRKRVERDLEEKERDFRSIFENAVEGIFQTTTDGRYLRVNPALARMYGFASPAELMGDLTNIARQLYVDPGRRDAFKRIMREDGVVSGFESEIYRKDGTTIWISENARAVRDQTGKIVRYEGTVEDVTARRLAEEEVRLQKAYFQQLFEASPQGIALVDLENRILDVNKGFEDIFGYRTGEVKGLTLEELVVPQERLDEALALTRSVKDHKAFQKESVRRRADGSPVNVTIIGVPIVISGEMEGIYYIYIDISEAKRIEQELAHQAFHDTLTGLANRVLLNDRIDHALRFAKRNPDYDFSVLFIDLDRFKIVNDSLGHNIGDRLLKNMAAKIESCIRSVDTLARLGGDEFVILLENVRRENEPVRVAERIIQKVGMPVTIDGHDIFVTASIGVVLNGARYEHSDCILRDADVAMYHAKTRGKNRFEIFDSEMHSQAVSVLQLENELRKAVEMQQFTVFYQPIVSLADGCIQAFEALVRWRHPQRGIVPPGDFIPLAEETGLIIPIGRAVLYKACRQLRTWQERYELPATVTMNVNLSSKQFQQPDLVEQILDILRTTGLDPHCLKLEITESVVMEDAERNVSMLQELKGHGVKIGIDDFGTGYSSLSYLHSFPIDTLKVDRSFVNRMAEDPQNFEIVKTIVGLAHNLKFDVVAEGIENVEQIACLNDICCEFGQGFYYSRPVSAGETEAALQEFLSKPKK